MTEGVVCECGFCGKWFESGPRVPSPEYGVICLACSKGEAGHQDFHSLINAQHEGALTVGVARRKHLACPWLAAGKTCEIAEVLVAIGDEE